MSSAVDALLRRAREGNHHAGLDAARRPEATAGQLEELAHNPLPETRRLVAEHPNTDLETLRRLGYDPDVDVAGGVAGRGDLPDDLREALLLRIRADFAAGGRGERARALALVEALADNPAVPLGVVEDLVETAPTSHLPRLLARTCERAEVLDLLLGHRKATVRKELVENPQLTYEQALVLRDDPHDKTARAAEARIARDFGADEAAGARRLLATVRDRGRERAPGYAADAVAMQGGPDAYDAALAWFADRLPDRERLSILDVGCADGALAARLAKSAPGGRIVGLDAAGALLERARAAAPAARFVQADLLRGLPLRASAVFDVIASWEGLHALPDPVEAIRAFARRLVPEGRLLVTLACLADDGEDNLLFAEAAARRGVHLYPGDALVTGVATSGLVIEALEGPEPTPAADAAVLRGLAWPGWRAILDEAVEAGARPEAIRRARVRVAARPASF